MAEPQRSGLWCGPVRGGLLSGGVQGEASFGPLPFCTHLIGICRFCDRQELPLTNCCRVTVAIKSNLAITSNGDYHNRILPEGKVVEKAR
jgi:hypothetical protein